MPHVHMTTGRYLCTHAPNCVPSKILDNFCCLQAQDKRANTKIRLSRLLMGRIKTNAGCRHKKALYEPSLNPSVNIGLYGWQ